MKYPFFNQKLGSISLFHTGIMLSQCEGLDYADRYFHVDTSMRVSEDLNFKNFPNLEAMVRDPKTGMAQFCNPAAFISASIDRMEPHSYVNEHSDATKAPWSKYRHKFHIPLLTNDRVGFMWGVSPVSVRMNVSEVHLYNNFDRHCVCNLGDTVRYHMVLRYTVGCFLPGQMPEGVDESESLAAGQAAIAPPATHSVIIRAAKGSP